MKLNLERPLVFFDLETTGTNIDSDRIVEICLIKVYPDGHDDEFTYRINPGVHIPEEASKVHGIYDGDVADCPTFAQLGSKLLEIISGCDLAGFNSNRFDVPMLAEEFSRNKFNFDLSTVRLIDVQNIFHKKEPRTLVAAMKFYCNEDLQNAHSAMADTRATYEVLKAQLNRYSDDPDIVNDVAKLADYTRMTKNADLAGKFVYNATNEVCFNFGTYKGQTVESVLRQNPGYYDWFIQKDFAKNSKDVIARIYMKICHPSTAKK